MITSDFRTLDTDIRTPPYTDMRTRPATDAMPVAKNAGDRPSLIPYREKWEIDIVILIQL